MTNTSLLVGLPTRRPSEVKTKKEDAAMAVRVTTPSGFDFHYSGGADEERDDGPPPLVEDDNEEGSQHSATTTPKNLTSEGKNGV